MMNIRGDNISKLKYTTAVNSSLIRSIVNPGTILFPVIVVVKW